MTPETFNTVAAILASRGLLDADIDWSENAGPAETPDEFAREAIFVICNSGMKNTVAQRIYYRVEEAIALGQSASTVFGHKGKTGAIDTIWRDRLDLFLDYQLIATDAERIEWLARLPWIGGITKFHLAKNFGVDVAKPDVHLQRLADRYGETVQGLCDRLAAASGWKSRTVDLVLWRACAVGIMDSRSGEVRR